MATTPTPPPARRALAASRARRIAPTIIPRASKNDDNNNNGAPSSSSDDRKRRYDAMLEQLRSTGLNQEKARRLLKVWAKAGALTPEELQRLLVKRSLAPARALGIQGGIDLGAAAFGFYTGSTIGQAGDFPGKIFLQIACYFGAMWYAISGCAGLAALATVVSAAKKYASSADALLAAVQTLAGPEGVAAAAREAGIGALAANVALAVNTAKVVAALDSVAQQLREMEAAASSGSESEAAATGAPLKRSTLVNLAAFLTVQDAEEKAGFRPEDYGLTEKEATDIAAVFAMFDSNENFILEKEELGAMCRRLGRELSDAEVREAVRLMVGGGADARAERGVTFPQFVKWWTSTGGGGAKKA